MQSDFESRLSWTREHMKVTAQALERLPDLTGVRLACSMHLEIKMVPAILGLVKKGAAVFLATCNPSTVCNETVAYCTAHGAEAYAFRGMDEHELEQGVRAALAFRPTHLCEMGADLTLGMLSSHGERARGDVRAGLEATGSGQNRLHGLEIPYPIFNWDDLPIKEGLHNRRMVGLVACHAFFERTRLTFHNKRVLIIGYGPVGRSACDAARAYGGRVTVSETDAARALEARFANEEVESLASALPKADIVITATGARHVIGASHIGLIKEGAFLINVGHLNEEIDLGAVYSHPHASVMPHVERITVHGRSIYLFAHGSMANLTAGYGDSLNAFDITLAAMVAGVGFIVGGGEAYAAGVHDLPRRAWMSVAEDAMAG